MIKIIIAGVTLFGSGMATGYFISRKILEDKYQCDVAEIRKLYQEKVDELEELIETVKNQGEEFEDEELDEQPPDDEDDEDLTEEDKQAMDALAVYRGERRRSIIEYNKPDLDTFKNARHEIFNRGVTVVVDPDGDETLGDIDEDDDYSPEDPDEYEEELERMSDDYALRRSENMQNELPYLIEPEEYREGPEGYDHQALYYYTIDRTLCEDDDSEVDDEEAVVGFDYEDKLDMQTTCWVRNDKLNMLYEIHRIDESYRATVLNAAETPREREFRLQGRRKQALDNKYNTSSQ